MYELNNTIVAVSSPSTKDRVILRLSGPDAIDAANGLFRPELRAKRSGLFSGKITIDRDLALQACVYLFLSPNSYTGQDVVEIHVDAGECVTGILMRRLLNAGLCPAGPGQFSARAYLNGKIDLSQAEAVNEIIVGSNRFQLAAAERLLAGRLTQTIEKIRCDIIDCLSLVEAGIDFCGEDIQFIAADDLIERLITINTQLQRLLTDSIRCEQVIDLPSVAIAGAVNAGKSSLLNALLGSDRSIVSQRPKTTRDVLTGILEMSHCRCVLFDCAGLLLDATDVIEQLAHTAAVEALRKAMLVLFCVDVAKADWDEDIKIYRSIGRQNLIAVATRSDLLTQQKLQYQISELKGIFGTDFIAASSVTGSNLNMLRKRIASAVIGLTAGSDRSVKAALCEASDAVALTERHRKTVTDAIENIEQAVVEIRAGTDETAAMLLRSACHQLSGVEHHCIDEKLLDRIFSRFCIGK